VVLAAAEIFRELGFAGASVAKIADRAGVTLGAVYFHFKSKDELAREIVSGQPDFVVPPLASQGLQCAVDVTLTWAYQLVNDPILQAGARLVWEQERFMDPEANSHDQWSELILAELRTARRRRELRAGTDITAVARLMVNACTGAQMQSYVEARHSDLPQRVEEIWRCVLPGIAVPSTIKRIELGEARGRVAS
jgi:AcrR family transcriptional regulator